MDMGLFLFFIFGYTMWHSWPKIKPKPFVVEAWSRNPWTARKIHNHFVLFINTFYFLKCFNLYILKIILWISTKPTVMTLVKFALSWIKSYGMKRAYCMERYVLTWHPSCVILKSYYFSCILFLFEKVGNMSSNIQECAGADWLKRADC